ncbi:hypothetical protein NUW54_g1327 [Trametes sanguinea]|uniref:Uncharacterized protein n=1 Tax=Trametes sanguinea TaxID=158606 RepID=A0ACC1Q6N2_9APHY|nr:hypothetical protein NUW54_g1327 [Trametes sanguinea]
MRCDHCLTQRIAARHLHARQLPVAELGPEYDSPRLSKALALPSVSSHPITRRTEAALTQRTPPAAPADIGHQSACASMFSCLSLPHRRSISIPIYVPVPRSHRSSAFHNAINHPFLAMITYTMYHICFKLRLAPFVRVAHRSLRLLPVSWLECFGDSCQKFSRSQAANQLEPPYIHLRAEHKSPAAATTCLFSATARPGIKTLRHELRHTMSYKLLGLPYDEWIDAFLHVDDSEVHYEDYHGLFDGVVTEEKECELLGLFIKAVNRAKILGDFVLAETHTRYYKTDKNKMKVDGGIYPKGSPAIKRKCSTDTALVEVFIECKTDSSGDPYDEGTSTGVP